MTNLTEQLTDASRGLMLMSETDLPVENFECEDLTGDIKDRLAALTEGKDESAPTVTTIAVDDFRQMYATEKDWQNEIQRRYARGFARLLDLLTEHTENFQIFRVGGNQADLYLIGNDAAANRWVGVKTGVVETGD